MNNEIIKNSGTPWATFQSYWNNLSDYAEPTGSGYEGLDEDGLNNLKANLALLIEVMKSTLVERSLDSVKERLECEHGIVLNNPAFTTYHVEMGEISSYPEGYKENAGIFCHNNPWVIIGETVAARGDDAWSHYKKILPSYVEEDRQTLHKVEPYVNCQMVAGKDAYRPGEGKNSWLTGTAAWMWYTVSEFILGIKPHYDGLLIDPCLPKTAHNYTVTRRFRGAEYEIHVSNPKGVSKGVAKMTVDGMPVEGSVVPAQSGKHIVEVVMG